MLARLLGIAAVAGVLIIGTPALAAEDNESSIVAYSTMQAFQEYYCAVLDMKDPQRQQILEAYDRAIRSVARNVYRRNKPKSPDMDPDSLSFAPAHFRTYLSEYFLRHGFFFTVYDDVLSLRGKEVRAPVAIVGVIDGEPLPVKRDIKGLYSQAWEVRLKEILCLIPKEWKGSSTESLGGKLGVWLWYDLAKIKDQAQKRWEKKAEDEAAFRLFDGTAPLELPEALPDEKAQEILLQLDRAMGYKQFSGLAQSADQDSFIKKYIEEMIRDIRHHELVHVYDNTGVRHLTSLNHAKQSILMEIRAVTAQMAMTHQPYETLAYLISLYRSEDAAIRKEAAVILAALTKSARTHPRPNEMCREDVQTLLQEPEKVLGSKRDLIQQLLYLYNMPPQEICRMALPFHNALETLVQDMLREQTAGG